MNVFLQKIQIWLKSQKQIAVEVDNDCILVVGLSYWDNLYRGVNSPKKADDTELWNVLWSLPK